MIGLDLRCGNERLRTAGIASQRTTTASKPGRSLSIQEVFPRPTGVSVVQSIHGDPAAANNQQSRIIGGGMSAAEMT
jgi:hypothetical protein